MSIGRFIPGIDKAQAALRQGFLPGKKDRLSILHGDCIVNKSFEFRI